MRDKVYLKEKQKAEIFKLINDGGSKKEVEKLYFALTKTALMPNTLKKYRKDAKKKKIKEGAKIREYTLPAEQKAFERKAVEVLKVYAESGDLTYSTIREILTWVQRDFNDQAVIKLMFSDRYIARFIRSHNFRSKNNSNQVPKSKEELNFERWRLNQKLLKFKPENIIKGVPVSFQKA